MQSEQVKYVSKLKSLIHCCSWGGYWWRLALCSGPWACDRCNGCTTCAKLLRLCASGEIWVTSTGRFACAGLMKFDDSNGRFCMFLPGGGPDMCRLAAGTARAGWGMWPPQMSGYFCIIQANNRTSLNFNESFCNDLLNIHAAHSFIGAWRVFEKMPQDLKDALWVSRHDVMVHEFRRTYYKQATHQAHSGPIHSNWRITSTNLSALWFAPW